MEEGTPPKKARLDDSVPAEVHDEDTPFSDPEGRAGSEEPTENEDALLEEELREAQAQLDQKHNEMLAKMRQIEAEYNTIKQPLYAARGNVIRRIPGFWLHCFLQHPEIRSIIGAVDQDILAFLDEVRVEPFATPDTGYRIVFVFITNEYFEERELTKEVHFSESEEQDVGGCRVSGCQVTWKPESSALLEKDGEDAASSMAFFRWFIEENDMEGGGDDPVANIIKDQLYVNPLHFMDADAEDAQAGIAADDFAGEEGVEDLDPEAEGLEENEYDEVPEGGEDDGSEYDEPEPGDEGGGVEVGIEEGDDDGQEGPEYDDQEGDGDQDEDGGRDS